jgi:hypothetical protein
MHNLLQQQTIYLNKSEKEKNNAYTFEFSQFWYKGNEIKKQAFK